MDPLPAADSLALNPSILFPCIHRGLWLVVLDSWEEWKFIPLVVSSAAEGCDVPMPTSPSPLPAPVVSLGDAFYLWLSPLGTQFVQTCLQLQLGEEQPLWQECWASQEGSTGLCLGYSVLGEAPKCGEELG